MSDVDMGELKGDDANMSAADYQDSLLGISDILTERSKTFEGDEEDEFKGLVLAAFGVLIEALAGVVGHLDMIEERLDNE